MNKGYWVVRANINNFDEYSKYIEIATEVIKKHSGNFIVRGGNQTEFEQKGFDRTVVVEFNSYQDALDCYNSSEYKSALKLVEISALRLVSVVEGI
jgi:uncharacterized protein (DUF1330 family)|tara:strand:+ start:43 stop:330 length:288 start_codon:yes stop_codon:yes gene_type:complete